MPESNNRLCRYDVRTIGGQRSEFSLVGGAIREGGLAEVTLGAPGSLKSTRAKCFLFHSLARGGLQHLARACSVVQKNSFVGLGYVYLCKVKWRLRADIWIIQVSFVGNIGDFPWIIQIVVHFFPAGLRFPYDGPIGEENNTDKCCQTTNGAWRVWTTAKLTFLEESLTLEALEMGMGKTSLLWWLLEF